MEEGGGRDCAEQCFSTFAPPQFRCHLLPGLFTLRVPKETAGEHFDGLQMLTSLLAPKGSRSAKALVEEVNTGQSKLSPCASTPAVQQMHRQHVIISKAGSAGLGDEEEEEEEEFEWQVEQEVYQETSEEELRSMQMYGFGNKRSGVFARLQVSPRSCPTRINDGGRCRRTLTEPFEWSNRRS